MSKKSAEQETAMEMFVGGLVLDPNTQSPVVVLKDEAGEICLPIWIGVTEATSIASVLKQVQMQRPLSHDLMHDIFGQLTVTLERVIITELRDQTYFAELVLTQGDRALVIDSRPSDAIALALRAHAPIFVAEPVLRQAKVNLIGPPGEGAPSAEGAAQGGEGAAEQEEGRPNADFKGIDRSKWKEILSNLDPDDFKYRQ